MPSPQQAVRRDKRYSLKLPVSILVGDREIDTQSENICLGGILLSTASFIPRGLMVELSVRVGKLKPDTFLTGRGEVVRVGLTNSGDFTVAIECEHAFELTEQGWPSVEYSVGETQRVR